MLVNTLLELRCLIGESHQFVEIRRYVPLAGRAIGNVLLHLLAILNKLSVRVIALLRSLCDFEDLSEEFLILKS